MSISIAPTLVRAAQTPATTPAASASDIGTGDEIRVQAVLAAQDVADPTLRVDFTVEGNNSANGNQGWYTVANMGGWTGGTILKDGSGFAPCAFGFRTPALNVIQRYRLTYTVSRDVTAGLNVFPQNLNAATAA